MKRFIDEYLQNWATQKNFKPLLVRGARQVGKTYAIRVLGQKFENFVEINLEQNAQARRIFEPDLDANRIVKEFTYLTKQAIFPGKTLLFLDEIQAQPQALASLRYFYEQIPNLHVIAAGSLLDFAIESVGVPVGRVEFLYVYPLSFWEFAQAKSAQIWLDAVLENSLLNPISDIVHQALLNLVKEYLAIGGMPEVVQNWINHQNIQNCFKIQQNLITAYRQDFMKYAKKHQIKYLDLLIDQVGVQLGQKFKYSDVPGEFRKRELAPCLELLVTAGIAHKVYCTAAQGLPLGAQADHDYFKIIFLDVALTQILLGLDLTQWMIHGNEQLINQGPIVEAFVGQELLAYHNSTQKTQLYYWERAERTAQAEVDYVINLANQIIPIEVKSGVGSTLKSMHIFLETHTKSPCGIRFSLQNYSEHLKIRSYPLYAIRSILPTT